MKKLAFKLRMSDRLLNMLGIGKYWNQYLRVTSSLRYPGILVNILVPTISACGPSLFINYYSEN